MDVPHISGVAKSETRHPATDTAVNTATKMLKSCHTVSREEYSTSYPFANDLRSHWMPRLRTVRRQVLGAAGHHGNAFDGLLGIQKLLTVILLIHTCALSRKSRCWSGGDQLSL
jgi:hypothetical protein